MSEPGANIPDVTADYTKSALPAHVPVQPGDKCSIMCAHLGIDRDASHQAAVDSWKREAAELCCALHDDAGEAERCCDNCPDILPTVVVNSAVPDGAVLVIDVAEVNQRELERRVAAGEPLPAGLTPEDVAAWRAEHPTGSVLVGLALGVTADDVELIPRASADRARDDL